MDEGQPKLGRVLHPIRQKQKIHFDSDDKKVSSCETWMHTFQSIGLHWNLERLYYPETIKERGTDNLPLDADDVSCKIEE